MTPKIYHETIDNRFKDFLEAISFNDFHEMVKDSTKRCKEFYIDYFYHFKDGKFELCFPDISNAEYKIEVQFEIDFKKMEIIKDREFNAVSLNGKPTLEIGIFRRSEISDTLQQILDKYVDKYNDWLHENS